MNPFGSFTKERRNGPKAPDTLSFPLEGRNLRMVAVSTTSPAAAIPNSPLAALQSPSSPPPPARPSTLRMVAFSTSPAIPNSPLAALPKQYVAIVSSSELATVNLVPDDHYLCWFSSCAPSVA
ncbi:unnamed protein product [Brassica oleracea]|uniref:(rape) hypothetical protein n=1 Tax=Brassica napus TaxID=3708 RepID=A0A816JD49_BRANA|nr:unnamed protein product [Brassica napus]